jgi:putative protease
MNNFGSINPRACFFAANRHIFLDARREVKTMPEEKIGVVTHYFGKAAVAALQLSAELHLGDRIHFHGHTTDFEMSIESMQIEHTNVEKAGPGDAIAIKVPEYTRIGDAVYKVT